MISHRMPLQNGHGQASRVTEVGGCTRPEYRGPVGRVAATLQCFGNPSPLLSGAPWWGISSALFYDALHPTPWISVAFPISPLVRRG